MWFLTLTYWHVKLFFIFYITNFCFIIILHSILIFIDDILFEILSREFSLFTLLSWNLSIHLCMNSSFAFLLNIIFVWKMSIFSHFFLTTLALSWLLKIFWLKIFKLIFILKTFYKFLRFWKITFFLVFLLSNHID